ncbi:hypothetical protein CTA2_10026 [Colletotrichum tanaceti]|uniref:Uncharacterized protein n=1 Tax=Colletotrichum tanaceti TaxID=1306861 RepID=A0A4U6XNM6_9PEZI|nr:hypothetical protein CTA2_10026 [Colletotrichum tanaceti]TKW57360.1 hypothetical protein CTA1_7783 [Colletotrichum tanaceti]
MAKSLRGSSFPQARSHHYNHYHLHDKLAATPENAHHHQHRQLDDDPSSTRSYDVQPSTTSGPKVVVQTVSLIQIVDASGVAIEVQTIFPTSATVGAEPTTSAALGFSIAAAPSSLSSSLSSSSSSSSSLSTGDPTSESSTTTITSSSSDDASLSTPAATTPSSTDPSASQESPLTSDPLTPTPAPSAPAPSLYLTLSGQSNSTISFLTSTNSSTTSFSTTTTLTSQLSSGTSSVTSPVISSLSSTWDSISDSTLSTHGPSTSTLTTSASSTLESTASGDRTAGVIGEGGGGGVGQPTATPTPTAGDSNSDGASTPTATVVGSVVGSLAGAAFLVVLVFFVLRWKKRSGGRFRLSEASMGKRGILTGSRGPEGGNGSGMIQRSLSYGPTAAAAGAGTAAVAAAHKPSSRRASEPSETGEKGFIRVAGRKLPSVLQSGGDGYTDPREGASDAGGAAGITNDDESVYYRDSQAFFDLGGQSPRLALGSPMRPVSGVVVLKESPARTPVTESAPFSDKDNTFAPLAPPARDPIGRTLPSQDGSRGSGSRFHEDM